MCLSACLSHCLLAYLPACFPAGLPACVFSRWFGAGATLCTLLPTPWHVGRLPHPGRDSIISDPSQVWLLGLCVCTLLVDWPSCDAAGFAGEGAWAVCSVLTKLNGPATRFLGSLSDRTRFFLLVDEVSAFPPAAQQSRHVLHIPCSVGVATRQHPRYPSSILSSMLVAENTVK